MIKLLQNITYILCTLAIVAVISSSSLLAQNYTMGSANNSNGSTVTTCSGNFYDSGGPSGNYGNNQNITVTFCASTPGQQIQFNFAFLDLNNGDILRVFNGVNTTAPLIYQCSACNTGPLSFQSTNSCLTFNFTSNNANNTNNNVGWSAAIVCFAPPANDNCNTATPISVGTSCIYTIGTNVNATASSGVTDPTCGLYSGGDVWYSFVAPESGSVTLTANSIVGGPADMDMALYSGTCGALTQLECDDFDGPGIMPQINYANLIPGQTYFARLWEFGNNAFGNFNFCIIDNGSSNPNVDCGGANQLCSDSQVSGASSGFGTQDLNTTNNGCLGVEHQSNWFYAQVTTAGVFSFSISPQVLTDDYDFAVWQYPAGSSVPCPPTTNPTRCSYSGVDGATGLGNGAIDNTESAAGNGWVAPINVSVGDILVILIDNFSSTTTPFTMDFTGTASLNCTPVPLECSIAGVLRTCVASTSQLTGTGTPAAANPWVSSNSAIATVSNSGFVTGVAAGTVTITYTDSQGCQASQVFTVNPRPVVSNIILQTCSGTPFSETPSSDAPNVIPIGTSYSWSAPSGSGFSGGASGSGSLIGGTLSNTGAAPVTATYNVTATAGIAPNQCSSTFNVIVTVNPRPVISAMSEVACSGQVFSITPVNGANGVVPAGTTYSWSAPSGSGFSGGAASNGASISGTLFNAGSAPVTANYVVTAQLGTLPNVCSGAFNVSVTVNPSPTATVSSNSPICIGGNAVFTITGTADALVTYSINSGPLSTVALAGGVAVVTVNGVTINQTLTLVSVSYLAAPACPQMLSASATVTFGTSIVPDFSNISSVYCQNAVVANPSLSTVSLNGITGSWSPTGISSFAPGTFNYVFTPDPGQCAVGASLVISVRPLPTTSAISHN